MHHVSGTGMCCYQCQLSRSTGWQRVTFLSMSPTSYVMCHRQPVISTLTYAISVMCHLTKAIGKYHSDVCQPPQTGGICYSNVSQASLVSVLVLIAVSCGRVWGHGLARRGLARWRVWYVPMCQETTYDGGEEAVRSRHTTPSHPASTRV